MEVRVSWRNAGHVLLQNVSVKTRVAGQEVVGTVAGGSASVTFPQGGGLTSKVELQVVFSSGPPLRVAETLRIVQRFEVPNGTTFSLLVAPRAVDYTIGPPVGKAVVVAGQHPLLQSFAFDFDWRLIIATQLVDASLVQPDLFATLRTLPRRFDPAKPNGPPGDPHSTVRVLARTDATKPTYWFCASPDACRTRPGSDVLCLFTPPQGAPAQLPVADQLQSANIGILAFHLAVFLGSGRHGAGGFFNDEVTDNSKDPARMSNFVLARGLEAAIVDSGRPVALALPFAEARATVPVKPSDGLPYRAASTDALPALLADVHRVLHALGDIGAAAKPDFGLAAYSNGGPSLFAAVAAAPKAYKELILLEAQKIADKNNLAALMATKGAAHVCIVGFSSGTTSGVVGALQGALGAPNVLRLPVTPAAGPPPENAAIAQLVARSPRLDGALKPIENLGAAPRTWRLRIIPHPPPKRAESETFALLHQYTIWGADLGGGATERHFLTQAVNGSKLRT